VTLLTFVKVDDPSDAIATADLLAASRIFDSVHRIFEADTIPTELNRTSSYFFVVQSASSMN
jgi:hypothetical protein